MPSDEKESEIESKTEVNKKNVKFSLAAVTRH